MNKRMRLAARRGATLVLVAVMLLVIGAMMAFALELAGVYGGVNELQTGADAAALAGGLRLQRTPGVSVANQTSAWATNNSAFVRPVTVSVSDVSGGFWDPAAGTFTPGAWATAAGAAGAAACASAGRAPIKDGAAIALAAMPRTSRRAGAKRILSDIAVAPSDHLRPALCGDPGEQSMARSGAAGQLATAHKIENGDELFGHSPLYSPDGPAPTHRTNRLTVASQAREWDLARNGPGRPRRKRASCPRTTTFQAVLLPHGRQA